MKVGVLALQGGFALHQQRLTSLGCKVLPVLSEKDLEAVDGLVLPGGESSTLLKLCPQSFRTAIVSRAKSHMPILATCAGVILIAHKVENPSQESLDILDVDVRRNAYGRQRESSIVNDLHLTEAGSIECASIEEPPEKIEGVFIRAPKITRTGKAVEILLTRTLQDETESQEPVLVKQKNILAATFHPELSEGLNLIHEIFISSLASS